MRLYRAAFITSGSRVHGSVVAAVVEEKIRDCERTGDEGRKRGERERGREEPRERISEKIIAKFEYDSPRGYDPVEDIPEILQASFVRGLLSLSAVFFSLPRSPTRLFLPSFVVVLSQPVSVSIYPSSLRPGFSRVN